MRSVRSAECAVRSVVVLGAVLLGAVPASAQEPIPIGTKVGVPESGYRMQGRRDPFAPLVTSAPPAATTAAASARRAPGLAGLAAADAVLKGIITSGQTRIALLEAPDGKTYLARAQDRLHDAVVRRIDEDAVVLLTGGSARGGREVRKELRPSAGGGQQ